MFLRNVYLRVYSTSQPRTSSTPSEPQNSHVKLYYLFYQKYFRFETCGRTRTLLRAFALCTAVNLGVITWRWMPAVAMSRTSLHCDSKIVKHTSWSDASKQERPYPSPDNNKKGFACRVLISLLFPCLVASALISSILSAALLSKLLR